VSAWFLVNGFGERREPDDDSAGPAASPFPGSAPDHFRSFDAYGGANRADVGDDSVVARVFPPAVSVKGLYVSAWHISAGDRVNHYIEICETTEVNSLVIDVKDDHGYITFLTNTEGIAEASRFVVPDMEGLVSNLKSRGIYTIARIVCFKDPLWSNLHPELAIRDRWGGSWQDRGGVRWLDPYKTGTWDYIASVCMEAVRVGFDEIQLDYVRFPADGRLGDIDYGTAGEEKSKTEIISEFMAYIREILAVEGIRLSADVFGIIAISNVDSQNIGQDLSLLLSNADSICPMIYPSHFANKRQNGTGQRINGVLFEAPDLEPYEVVYNILLATGRHLDPDMDHAIIRPYLQDFTASYLGEGYYIPYTAQQVREQIQAVYDAGFVEWIIWNHISEYSADAFEAVSSQGNGTE